MSCPVCRDDGIGPDGSYCRNKGCQAAAMQRLQDSNQELVSVLATVDGWRVREAQMHAETIRDLQKLRFYFQKYGRHHRTCLGKPCTCGFAEVRLQGVRW